MCEVTGRLGWVTCCRCQCGVDKALISAVIGCTGRLEREGRVCAVWLRRACYVMICVELGFSSKTAVCPGFVGGQGSIIGSCLMGRELFLLYLYLF